MAKHSWIALTLFFVLLGLGIYFSIPSQALDGAYVAFGTNSTKNSTNASSRTDYKGTITTINISTTQQDMKWKAYVGNASGTLVLADAEDFNIYSWSLGSNFQGEIVATRASNPLFTSVSCADVADILNEDTALGHSSSSVDSINRTYNYTRHEGFQIAGNTIADSTCNSTFAYTNSILAGSSNTSAWQQIVLQDASNNLLYTTRLETAAAGYNPGVTVQFQLLVPENGSASTPDIPYYFYIELD